VELIVDKDLNFYFLEMNTRLQVEHPVTEMITGLDLVREQIRIAEGHPLSFTQADLSINGHAIEIRVYAEDPTNNFLPDIGLLAEYQPPAGPGIRVDDGYREGMQVPIYYDPMLAKLIVHAPTRQEAIEKMLRAIRAYRISGVETTLDFCRFVLAHPAFRSGHFTTGFVNEHFRPELLTEPLTPQEAQLAAVFAGLFFTEEQQALQPQPLPQQPTRTAWQQNRG
jgi:propionyl-CoA carboxylase alpha chain